MTDTPNANPAETQAPAPAAAGPATQKSNLPLLGGVAVAAAVVTFVLQVTVLKPKAPPAPFRPPIRLNQGPNGRPGFPMRNGMRPGFPPPALRPMPQAGLGTPVTPGNTPLRPPPAFPPPSGNP